MYFPFGENLTKDTGGFSSSENKGKHYLKQGTKNLKQQEKSIKAKAFCDWLMDW